MTIDAWQTLNPIFETEELARKAALAEGVDDPFILDVRGPDSRDQRIGFIWYWLPKSASHLTAAEEALLARPLSTWGRDLPRELERRIPLQLAEGCRIAAELARSGGGVPQG